MAYRTTALRSRADTPVPLREPERVRQRRQRRSAVLLCQQGDHGTNHAAALLDGKLFRRGVADFTSCSNHRG